MDIPNLVLFEEKFSTNPDQMVVYEQRNSNF